MPGSNVDSDEQTQIPGPPEGSFSSPRDDAASHIDLGPASPSDSPWTDMEFWKSLGRSAIKGLAVLAAVVVLSAMLGLFSSPQTSSGDSQERALSENLKADALSEPAVINSNASAPASEQLIGSWVQAERGGEDGETICGHAESMTTFNGGSTEAMQFYRNGSVEYELWYDTAFESRGDANVRAAYNSGTWSLVGNQLRLALNGGQTGLFGSDLGPEDVVLEITIAENVMTQVAQRGRTRFVRCR